MSVCVRRDKRETEKKNVYIICIMNRSVREVRMMTQQNNPVIIHKIFKHGRCAFSCYLFRLATRASRASNVNILSLTTHCKRLRAHIAKMVNKARSTIKPSSTCIRSECHAIGFCWRFVFFFLFRPSSTVSLFSAIFWPSVYSPMALFEFVCIYFH